MANRKNTPSATRLSVSLPGDIHCVLERLSGHFDVSMSALVAAVVRCSLFDLEEAQEWAEAHARLGSEEWHRGRSALLMFDAESIPKRLQYITPGWQSAADRNFAGALARAEFDEALKEIVADWRKRKSQD